MQTSSVSSTLVATRVAISCLFVFLFLAESARAQTSPGSYSLLVASGFLCDLGESGNCLAIARSTNGDSYELSGAGTFDSHNKSVKAAGTFSHKATNGNILEAGVWIATDLVSFGSYGTSPTALLKKGPAFGTVPAGTKRLSMPLGPMPTGGLAVFRVLILPLSGTSKTALLEVNCALGDVPRDRSVEGIRLTFEKGVSEYSEEVSGRVIFLATRLPVTTRAKTSDHGAVLDTVDPHTTEQQNPQ